MRVKWLQRSDGPRDVGYVEDVDDHLAVEWMARGLVEEVVTRDVVAPPEHRAVMTPPVRKGRKG